MRKFIAAVAMGCVLAVTTTAAPAAANPTPDVTWWSSGQAGKCYVQIGTPGNLSTVGGMMCGGSNWYFSTHRWGDGRWELFIIGWNQAMWHIFQPSATSYGWSAWYTMGGGFTRGAFKVDDSPWLVVGGYGLSPNQNKLYCKSNVNGVWSPNWYVC